MTALRFLLNGEPRAEANASPTMTVLDWLRTVARLTGTKEGCAEGDCGACTVLVGRNEGGAVRYQAVNSCLMMLPQIDGRCVLTVEGLASADGMLHPVQQALVDADATQCGFCTPGFAMAMVAFQHGGEPPEDARIHEALAGNLCRCTGYRSIVDACRRIAAGGPDSLSGGAAPCDNSLRALPAAAEYRAGDQVFYAPRSLDELLALTTQFPDALVLAGGTDLGLRVSKDREPLAIVISTAAVDDLRGVATSDAALEIGGAVTYTEALPHLDTYFPAFGAVVRRIGSRQIRNLGTLAGNLATASPIGDTLPCLIALDATIILRSLNGKRSLPIESFVTGYRKTALTAGEVIAAISIPFTAPRQWFAAYKLSKRFDQDISTVIAAFRLELDDGKVRDLRAAYGGMAPRAMRAAHVEQALAGRSWTLDSLTDIDAVMAHDFAPISDHRGSATYRGRAAAGLLRRFQIATSTAAPVRLEAL